MVIKYFLLITCIKMSDTSFVGPLSNLIMLCNLYSYTGGSLV